METSLGSGKQFSTLLQTRSGEAPPTLYCIKDLKAKTNFSRARYKGVVTNRYKQLQIQNTHTVTYSYTRIHTYTQKQTLETIQTIKNCNVYFKHFKFYKVTRLDCMNKILVCDKNLSKFMNYVFPQEEIQDIIISLSFPSHTKISIEVFRSMSSKGLPGC